jgi:hypothetical protein
MHRPLPPGGPSARRGACAVRPSLAPGPEDPITWRDDGLPASRLYGDVYFSSDDGLAETRAVYLAGCGLPEAWAGRRPSRSANWASAPA